jgi:hypothetical protein
MHVQLHIYMQLHVNKRHEYSITQVNVTARLYAIAQIDNKKNAYEKPLKYVNMKTE